MTRRPQEDRMTKNAIRLHGWMLIGASLGTVMVAANTFLQVPSSVSTWVEHGLLAIVGILFAVLGVTTIRFARRWHHIEADLLLPGIVRAAAILLLAMGIFLVYRNIDVGNTTGGLRTGISWVLAGAFGLTWVRKRIPAGDAKGDPNADVWAVLATAMFLVGIAGFGPLGGSPFQLWSMLSVLLTGWGVLGGVALLVATLSVTIKHRVAATASSDAVFGSILSASTLLLGIRLLFPTFGFVFDFRWQQLADPPFSPQSTILLMVAFYVLVAAILVWAVAAVLTVVAGGTAFVRHVGTLDVKRIGGTIQKGWSRLRETRSRGGGATGWKAVPASKKKRTLTCPECKAKVTLDVDVPPVCPKCWYSGPK